MDDARRYRCPKDHDLLFRCSDHPTQYRCPADHRYELDEAGVPITPDLNAGTPSPTTRFHVATPIVGMIRADVLADTPKAALDFFHMRLRRLIRHFEQEWTIPLDLPDLPARFPSAKVELWAYGQRQSEVAVPIDDTE